jgi:hypothetical protein
MTSFPYDLNWLGTLTISNVEKVAGLFRQLLEGKTYSFVSAIETSGFKPDVQTNRCLADDKNAIVANIQEEHGFATFNVIDSRGLWGCFTTAKKNVFDATYNNPYIVFSKDKVRITHRSPAGHLIYWVVAVERNKS